MSVALAYRDYGKGPPLLVVHGLFGSGRNWHSIAKRLSDRFRIFAVDLRNHGDSPWTPTMTLDDLCSDLLRFLDDHHIPQATVLGHSLGGKASMLLALRHAPRVEQLIVVDIAPAPYAHGFAAHIAAMRTLDVSSATRRAEAAERLAATLADPATAGFLAQNLATGTHGLVWKLNLDGIDAAMPSLLGFPAAIGTSYEGRTLFIRGDHSDYIGRDHQGQLFSLFPQAEFAVISEAGHRVHADQPGAFVDTLLDFVDSAYA
jgi:pimeloyl-ACP methyl ester carboxylesterase